MDEEHNTQENKEGAAYRKPKVQNFRSLKHDLQKVSQDPEKSLAKIVLASKARKWEELEKGDDSKKVYVKNTYAQPKYKILLIIIILAVLGLVLYRNMTPADERLTNTATSSTSSATSSQSTTTQDSTNGSTSEAFTNE